MHKRIRARFTDGPAQGITIEPQHIATEIDWYQPIGEPALIDPSTLDYSVNRVITRYRAIQVSRTEGPRYLDYLIDYAENGPFMGGIDDILHAAQMATGGRYRRGL